MLTPNHALKASIDEAIERTMRELRVSTQNGNCEGEGAAVPNMHTVQHTNV